MGDCRLCSLVRIVMTTARRSWSPFDWPAHRAVERDDEMGTEKPVGRRPSSDCSFAAARDKLAPSFSLTAMNDSKKFPQANA
jgi:hypothetical protein